MSIWISQPLYFCAFAKKIKLKEKKYLCQECTNPLFDNAELIILQIHFICFVWKLTLVLLSRLFNINSFIVKYPDSKCKKGAILQYGQLRGGGGSDFPKFKF